MKLPIYLDYAATTPVDPRVAQKMTRYLTADGVFGNSSSRAHQFGWQAEEAVDIARNQIADLLAADAREIIFTSGATEADNLAIKGVAHACQHRGRHIITCQSEHKAVLDSCHQLEQEGFSVSYLPVQSNGGIDLNCLRDTIRADTILVSIMHVNNETGVVQDIAAIGALCQQQGVLFHTDATQSVGKLPLDLRQLPVDLLSCTAHKIYGPKGIGALYLRRNSASHNGEIHLTAQMHGGGHERGMRSGTLPVHQIVAMGEAYHIAQQEMAADMARITRLRDRLWQGISTISGVQVNSDLVHGCGHILHISFAQLEGESLIMLLKDLAISTGSACASANLVPSHVLRAMALPDELAHSALRFSLGRFTSEQEIDYAIDIIGSAVARLRASMSR